ncbi:hypothetical protein BC826DRAFT_1021071, partial [Russula brevipes]
MLKGESWGRGSGRDAGTERGVHGGAARKGSGLVHGGTANAGKRERTAARHTRRNADERDPDWVV